MILNLRSIVVAIAILLALGSLGWFAASDGGPTKPADKTPAALPGRGGFGSAAGPVAVIVAPVRQEKFAAEVEAIGTARANEAVDITAKTSNRITAIRFREGQEVKVGDVLVEFDSAEVRANLAAAEAALAESRSQFNRSRELYETKALSQAQLEQLQSTLRANEARVAAAQSQLNDTIIRAPFNGRVGLRNVSIGSLVNPGTVITTLDDTSVIKLDFAVPEVYLATLREGLEIKAQTAAYSDQVFIGRVTSIDSRVDPVSRSVTVRAQLANAERRLRPGMFMTVSLLRSESLALLIPEQAVVPEGEQKFVFVVREGKAYKTQIETARRRPGEVEVVDGLSAGEIIVVEGIQKLRDGMPVQAQADPAHGAGLQAQQRLSRTYLKMPAHHFCSADFELGPRHLGTRHTQFVALA